MRNHNDFKRSFINMKKISGTPNVKLNLWDGWGTLRCTG